jgi:mannose-6-phosphate isomerase-like protein (cupin superfamily)
MILDKPWGRVTSYTLNQPASVRIVEVHPGQQTSLQYHQLRDELWVILDAGLRVQIGDDVRQAAPGDEFMVPAEKSHRIINSNPPGPPGRVLEIAYGYTTEDDVHRLEDDYGRPLEPDW